MASTTNDKEPVCSPAGPQQRERTGAGGDRARVARVGHVQALPAVNGALEMPLLPLEVQQAAAQHKELALQVDFPAVAEGALVVVAKLHHNGHCTLVGGQQRRHLLLQHGLARGAVHLEDLIAHPNAALLCWRAGLNVGDKDDAVCLGEMGAGNAGRV